MTNAYLKVTLRSAGVVLLIVGLAIVLESGARTAMAFTGGLLLVVGVSLVIALFLRRK